MTYHNDPDHNNEEARLRKSSHEFAYLAGYRDYPNSANPHHVGTVENTKYAEGFEQAARDREELAQERAVEYWSLMDDGQYDDDPSPYSGTYSEM